MTPRNDPSVGYITLRYPNSSADIQSISGLLNELVRTDPRNALPEGDNIRIWDEPIVGVAAATDPLFERLKQPDVVGDIHESPEFWVPGAKSVISFFLPFTREMKKTYDRKSRLPSLEWVSARQNGEVFLNVARRALARHIEKLGARAIVPTLDIRYGSAGLVPIWSERHVAFIAGVGTFGLHAGLLTEKGAAGRIGSVVTDLELAPTTRPYTDVYEYCPGITGECSACITRCPVDAITEKGKDHQICVSNGADYIRPAFREWGYHSCGHCQTHLPCADGIPAKVIRKRAVAARTQLAQRAVSG